MNFKKALTFIMAVMMLLSVALIPASAKEVEATTYYGYEYNTDGESIAAPITYVYNREITFADLGLGDEAATATDFYWYNDTLYVLDSGKGRILELDSTLALKNVREAFTDKEGNPISFVGTRGFTVGKNGLIYVCDTENKRVLIFNNENQLTQTIEKPDTSLVGYEFDFDVTKIMLNNQGMIYVVVESVNDGVFAFSPEGEFEYFYGRNTVNATVDVILNFFRKKFMTREQLSKIKTYTPVSVYNFDIDERGFVYTISKSETMASDASKFRILNFKGTDTFENQGITTKFGDLEKDTGSHHPRFTSFIDVDVDSQGFVRLLDEGRGRIFEYSADGQLIGMFGAYGSQKGQLGEFNSLESINEKVYVLGNDGTITEFVPTEYTTYLREAYLDLDTSEPKKAVVAWEKVLKLNTNSSYPYYGLGMAYEKLGDYKKAMECFRLADAVPEYSDAFHEYRKEFIGDNLLVLVLAAIAIIVGAVFLIRFVSKKLKTKATASYSPLESKYAFPLYTLTHPSDGFGQFKYRRDLPSFALSFGIIAVFFFVTVFQYFATGYCHGDNDPAEYSIFSTLLGTVALYILFVVGHWAVCSLLDGNGTLKEIASATAYALIPFIISRVITTILSNFLTTDEAIMMTIITVIGVVWSVMILFVGLSEVNQYYTGKTLLTIVITVFAMLILALIAFLFFTLIQQVLYFFSSIWNEYQMR